MTIADVPILARKGSTTTRRSEARVVGVNRPGDIIVLATREYLKSASRYKRTGVAHRQNEFEKRDERRIAQAASRPLARLGKPQRASYVAAGCRVFASG